MTRYTKRIHVSEPNYAHRVMAKGAGDNMIAKALGRARLSVKTRKLGDWYVYEIYQTIE